MKTANATRRKAPSLLRGGEQAEARPSHATRSSEIPSDAVCNFSTGCSISAIFRVVAQGSAIVMAERALTGMRWFRSRRYDMFIAQLEGGRCPVKLANPSSMGALAAVVGGALWMAAGLRYLTDPVPIINWGSTYVGDVVFGFGF